MNEQLSLFEMPPSGGVGYNPVLAVFPDQYAVQQISSLGNSLREMHRLYGKMRPPTHFHVSLPFPRRGRCAFETAVANIGRVCTAVAKITSPFEIKFDRVKSFHGKPGNCPLVLVNADHENDGIQNLQRLLRAEFAKLGPGASSIPKFTPHLTLLY